MQYSVCLKKHNVQLDYVFPHISTIRFEAS